MDNKYVILYEVKLINDSEGYYYSTDNIQLHYNRDSMCYEFEKDRRIMAVFPANQIIRIAPVRLSADQVEFDTIYKGENE